MNITDIDPDNLRSLLPHRFPMQFIGSVEKFDGTVIVCKKNVTINEPFFLGHFPNHSIMPGCITIECAAQVAAYLYVGKALMNFNDRGSLNYELVKKISNSVGYLIEVKKFKFLKPIIPGDTLLISCIEMNGNKTAKIDSCKIVNQKKEIVASGNIMVTKNEN